MPDYIVNMRVVQKIAKVSGETGNRSQPTWIPGHLHSRRVFAGNGNPSQSVPRNELTFKLVWCVHANNNVLLP